MHRSPCNSFDGVTAAVFGVLIPLTVADIAFGSGHFNLAQGVVCTADGNWRHEHFLPRN